LNVKSLKKIDLYFSGGPSDNEISAFLKQQQGLQELSFYNFCDSVFSKNPEILELDCRLLRFRFSCCEKFDEHEELIKFLQIHQQSLKSLTIAWTGNSYELVRRYIVEHMKSLKYLSVSFLEWIRISIPIFFGFEDLVEFHRLSPESRDIYRQDHPELSIEIGTNVESLKCSVSNDLDTNKYIFDAFRNVKKLRLNVSDYCPHSKAKEILEYVAEVMLDLETLTTDAITSTKAYFPNLKELIVQYISKENIFIDFIRRHSAFLEKIEFNNCPSEAIVDELLNCSNLKQLISARSIDHKILNRFSERIKPLCLKIVSGLETHCFIFPDDKLDWDAFVCSQVD
jgi:hypothetical protein